MKHRMKRRKKIIIAAVVILIILMAGLVFGGNYLVDFSIGRNTDTGNIAPESTLSDEAARKIADRWVSQQKNAQEWISSSDVEEVYIQSFDGLRLKAECIVTDDSSHLWVIGIHGYRSNHSGMEVVASYYGKRGFNALLPDMRGCGESEGDFIGMGWPDRKDVSGWIDWILKRDEEARIILHGISMGGATVMMTAGEELPVQVKAVVEDCGYTSVWDIFEDELQYLFHLPAFPILNIASGIASRRAGYSFKEASALNQVKKAKVPILFIHGSEDNFVHTEMVYRLYDACASEKEMLIVEGAGHGNSSNHDPEGYFSRVFAFVDKYTGQMNQA